MRIQIVLRHTNTMRMQTVIRHVTRIKSRSALLSSR